MQTFSHNKATADLVNAIDVLQKQARAPSDVASWLLEHADLLRRVSQELGHTVQVDDMGIPAVITELGFSDFDEVYLSGGWENGRLVEERLYARADSYWNTDESIHLSLIFNRIKELGISLYRPTDLSIADYNSMRSIVFSPAYWPMAAAAVLNQMVSESTRFGAHLEQMLHKHFPSTSYTQFVQLHAAGLFTNEAMLCDWLLSNEIIQSYPQGALLPSDVLAL